MEKNGSEVFSQFVYNNRQGLMGKSYVCDSLSENPTCLHYP